MLRRQRAIEIVPGSKPLRRRRYDVPQHLAPETSDALRFCAVEGDLDLPDRRHRSTIEAGSSAVAAGPPLARSWRVRPALDDEQDLKPGAPADVLSAERLTFAAVGGNGRRDR